MIHLTEYHSPDPRMKVRACPYYLVKFGSAEACEYCHGRGYAVGQWVEGFVDGAIEYHARKSRCFIPAACQDVIEVRFVPRFDVYGSTKDGWAWKLISKRFPHGWPSDHYAAGMKSIDKDFNQIPWPTAVEALRAAREAYWGVEIITNESIGETTATYRLPDGRVRGRDYDTPDAALIAAIDARDAKGGG